MQPIRLSKVLQCLVAIIGLRQLFTLIYEPIKIAGRDNVALAIDLPISGAILFFVVFTLLNRVWSIRILSWVLRVLGIFSIVGMALSIGAAKYRPIGFQEAEWFVTACLFVVVGIGLANTFNRWQRTLQHSELPQLDVQEPFVPYPRP